MIFSKLKWLGTPVLFLGLTACALKPLEDQKLYWKPTEGMGQVTLGNLDKYKFKIEQFQDERRVSPKNKVGENVGRAQVRLVLANTDDFGPFVTTYFTEALNTTGVNVVDSNENFILTGAIKDFQVREDNAYEGTTSIKYILRKGNTEVFSIVITSSARRFGRTYKMDNYMEVLSDALNESVRKLVSSPTFQAAVESKSLDR